MSTHVLSLLVEDKPGLLTRVAGLFARRGFNIESLAVGASELEGLSRITVVVTVEGVSVETPKPNARCGEGAEQAGLRATTPDRICWSEYQLPNTPMRHSRVPSS